MSTLCPANEGRHTAFCTKSLTKCWLVTIGLIDKGAAKGLELEEQGSVCARVLLQGHQHIIRAKSVANHKLAWNHQIAQKFRTCRQALYRGPQQPYRLPRRSGEKQSVSRLGRLESISITGPFTGDCAALRAWPYGPHRPSCEHHRPSVPALPLSTAYKLRRLPQVRCVTVCRGVSETRW